jgi:hypothetical protein
MRVRLDGGVDRVVAALVCWRRLPHPILQQDLSHPLPPARLNQKRFSLHRTVFHSPIILIYSSSCTKFSPRAPVNPN